VGRIAVTGTASFLGARLLRRLVDSRGADAVLAVDVAPPPATLEGVRHRMVDLTLPGADQRLVDAFTDEEVDVVVHAAFFTSPHRDAAYAHELESIGTLHLAAGAAASGVRRLVLRSFTALYGASGQNPNFLTEAHPLRRGDGLSWLRDKVEAEQHTTAYGKRYPGMKVTILRLAPVLGPGVHSFYSRVLSKRVVPVLLGYDPLLQLLHPEDAIEAFVLALAAEAEGPINIVPRDSVSLLTALHLADKVTVAVPHPVAYAAADLLWSAGLGAGPSGFLDYVRYPCVADGECARQKLGFEARFGSRAALESFLRYRYPEATAAADAEALA
jgi:UDP-glucose 4-epimerase